MLHTRDIQGVHSSSRELRANFPPTLLDAGGNIEANSFHCYKWIEGLYLVYASLGLGRTNQRIYVITYKFSLVQIPSARPVSMATSGVEVVAKR
jgi:hypothetical protein